MRNVPAVLEALDPQRAARPTVSRGTVISRLLIGFMLVLVFLGFLGAGFYSLWRAWQTTNWPNFWILTIPLIILVIFVLVIYIPFRFSRQLGNTRVSTADMLESAEALRRIAASDDEKLAPLAKLQPAPLVGLELPSGQVRIGPLARPVNFNINPTRMLWLLFAIFFPIILLFIFLPLWLDSIGIPGISNDFSSLVSIFSALIPCLAVLFIFPIAFVNGVRRRRKNLVHVVADGHGFSWQQKSKEVPEQSIPWDQVRSLSRIVYTGYGTSTSSRYTNANTLAQQVSYVLDTPDKSFTWTTSTLSPAAQFEASEQLLRLAVSRTGKPLRDLSDMMSEVVQAGVNVGRILSSRFPTGSRVNWTPVEDAISPATRSQRKYGRIMGWTLLLLIPILLIGCLFGGGAYLQYYQSAYFAGLPTRIHAEQPLYTDSLSSPDGQWLIQQPSSDDPGSYTYVQGGYQLGGTVKGNFVCSTQSQQFGDAAYEVTAIQSGPSATDGDGVGIIFNATDASCDEFMAFWVDSTGTWQLYYYKYTSAGDSSTDWNYLDSGQSNAINTGDNEPNTMLIVVRGQAYLFYINGQYVGSYSNTYKKVPSSGFAGLYLNDQTRIGTFTNFSIYPVKPASFPLSWDYL